MHQFNLKKDKHRHRVIDRMLEKMKTLIRDEKYEDCAVLQNIIDTLEAGKNVVLIHNLSWEMIDFLANGLYENWES